MREVLLDMLDHTHGLGFITELLVTGSSDETLIETMDENKRVIIKGYLKNPSQEFTGEFGCKELAQLKGMAGYPGFKSDGATISVVTQNRGGEDTPEKIVFESENQKHHMEFRFTNPQYIEDQFEFMQPKWSAQFNMNKSTLNDLRYWSTTFADALFTAKCEDGELRFYLGGDNNGYITIPTENDVDFKFDMKWPLNEVLAVLKLDEEAEVSIFDDPRAGALQIKTETDLSTWYYIFPLVRA